jgi:inhibitor of KinA sporulation pathway (predicted exonuclease)
VRTDVLDLIVVCDLEATCWSDGEIQLIDNMEVIEIGCVLCDMGGNIKDEFTTFVRPEVNPRLSPFCTQLTSITQEDVDHAPLFEEAMALLDKWTAKHYRMWCSWGNFDRKLLLSQQQRIERESQFTKLPHVNLKKAWRRTTKQRQHNDLESALRFHELEFEGTPHRAISDARNTARLLPHIAASEIDLQRYELQIKDQY